MNRFFSNPLPVIRTGILSAALLLSGSCSQGALEETPVPTNQTPALETRTNTIFEDSGITLMFFDMEEEICNGQRLNFRVLDGMRTLFGDDQVKIEISHLADGSIVPLIYDPSMTNYFFTPELGGKMLIRVTPMESPEITAEFHFKVWQAPYLKMVTLEEHNNFWGDPSLVVRSYGIHFFADKACTQRISAPKDMRIHVRLIKKAVELFPTATLLYRNEIVHVGAGWEDTCNYRLTTVHQTLPSGERLDDYYEIDFVDFVRY